MARDPYGDHNYDQNIAMTSHDYPIVQVTNLIILGLSSISTETR